MEMRQKSIWISTEFQLGFNGIFILFFLSYSLIPLPAGRQAFSLIPLKLL